MKQPLHFALSDEGDFMGNKAQELQDCNGNLNQETITCPITILSS